MASSEQELEVLFREARRRRRRRRMVYTALAVAAGLAVWLVVSSRGSPRPPAARAARHAHPRAPAAAPDHRAQATVALPAGKWSPGVPVFFGQDGLLSVSGGSDSADPQIYAAWFERSTDGGARWEPFGLVSGSSGPAYYGQLTFVSPRIGWSVGGPGVDGKPEVLSYTTDGGVTWHRQPGGTGATSVAAAGRSTWIVRYCPKGGCPAIVTVTRPGATPRPLASQPGPSSCAFDVLRPTPSVAFALTDGCGQPSLHVTTNGGGRWTARPLPCAGPADGLKTTIADGGADDLWVTCQRFSGLTDPDDVETVIYQSADAGATWRRITPPGPAQPTGQLWDFQTLYVVNPSDAWALESDQSGVATVVRSTDGGRHWQTVLSPESGRAQRAELWASGLDATTATAATISGSSFAPFGQLVVLRTTDGGRTWHVTELPTPRLPRPPS